MEDRREYIDILNYGIMAHTVRRRGLYSVKALIWDGDKLHYELYRKHENNMIIPYVDMVIPGGNVNQFHTSEMHWYLVNRYFSKNVIDRDPLAEFILRI